MSDISIEAVQPILTYYQYTSQATQNGEAVEHITKARTVEGGRITSVQTTSLTVYDSFGNLQTIPPNDSTIIKTV